MTSSDIHSFLPSFFSFFIHSCTNPFIFIHFFSNHVLIQYFTNSIIVVNLYTWPTLISNLYLHCTFTDEFATADSSTPLVAEHRYNPEPLRLMLDMVNISPEPRILPLSRFQVIDGFGKPVALQNRLMVPDSLTVIFVG